MKAAGPRPRVDQELVPARFTLAVRVSGTQPAGGQEGKRNEDDGDDTLVHYVGL
jgi:hypothetical protein